MSRRPVIVLLTDFGQRDHYVGVMKGVVLGICPEATLVDLSHDIPAQDVAAGARELAAAYRYFPAGAVFLAVVDPGVGSGRRALAAEAAGYTFVGPDNGLLSLVFREHAPSRLVALTDPQFARPEVSPTFEGRDRFAPAAAWIAAGVDIARLGLAVDTWVRAAVAEPQVIGRDIAGEVVRVDRFGNLVTNIDRRLLGAFTVPGDVRIEVAGRTLAGLVMTYAEAPEGALCALIGSTGDLEIACAGGSAAQVLGAGRGAAVRVSAPA